MKRCCVAAVALLMARLGTAQQALPPSIGVALIGGTASCPVFIGYVSEGSPAERAGIKSGDVLLTMDGTPVKTSEQGAKLLRTKGENLIHLELLRDDKHYTAALRRENSSTATRKQIRQNGMDPTQTEIDNKMHVLKPERFAGRVFPTHYPSNDKLYYGGFEVLILKNPPQVAVLGIEDGPASWAGVHWGDIIQSVNGVDPRNKSVAELESLFSSEKPSTMTLKIEREGASKQFIFPLAQAAQVLQDNQLELLQGTLVPRGLPERYLPCFSGN
jgi:C-terminal processing protease CtpA/Prc